MNSHKLWLTSTGLAVALSLALCGCGKMASDLVLPNQPPSVRLIAAPIQNAAGITQLTGLWTNLNRVRFAWEAVDPDGAIAFFRYAINDTTTPEDWLETTDDHVALFFPSADSTRVDTLYIGGSQLPIERYVFSGAYTFFLKAIDDEGATSPTISVSFTSETIAPETAITNPHPAGVLNLGAEAVIHWTGDDFDGTRAPVGYSWRLVQVDNVLTMSDEEIEETLLDPASSGEPWSAFAPHDSVRLTDLPTPAHFALGVRAMDEAGAVEPRMRTFRSPGPTNVLLFRTTEAGVLPRLQVSSSVRTVMYPSGNPVEKTFQIPANRDVRFTWVADASPYGGDIAGYAYGLDCDSLEETDPCWSPESPTLTEATIHFAIPDGSPPEEHVMFIRARDNFGNTLIADVWLLVVPLQLDRDVVYVDDWGKDDRGRTHPDIGPHCEAASNGGYIPDEKVTSASPIPQDSCHDFYMRNSIETALERLGHPDWVVDRYEVLDPVVGQALSGPVEIDSVSQDHWVLHGPATLEQLSRYKLVIWNTRSDASNALKKLNSGGEDNSLAVYLQGGGTVWITGTGVFTRTLHGEYNTPGLSVFGLDTSDFTYQFLHVWTEYDGLDCLAGCFRQGGNTARYRRENGFEGAYRSPMAEEEGFPYLRVSREPIGNNSIRGVEGCDAMVVPHGIEMNPILETTGGRLDTLYFYQSNWRLEVLPPGTSWMDDAAVGLRYSGPDQGRLMMFGFPFFYFPENQIEDLLTAGTRWLLDE